MAKAKKVIRKRAKKASAKTVEEKAAQEAAYLDRVAEANPNPAPFEDTTSWLDLPRFSISDFNEHLGNFTKQAAEAIVNAADAALVEDFLTRAKYLPEGAEVVTVTAQAMRAVAKIIAEEAA